MYQNHIHHGYLAAICWSTADKKIGCMWTSFACGEFTSIEKEEQFDLWQMSYAPRSSLRSLRYASQKLPRAKLGIVRHVWTCLGMSTKRVSASVYSVCGIISPTKYYLIWSTGSWDIQILKIEQSDWPRAFRSVIWEPYFSQTCSFQRIIENMFDFRTLRTNISAAQFFAKLQKPYFLGHFWHFLRKIGKTRICLKNRALSLFNLIDL